MKKQEVINNNGIGFFGLLSLMFIGLKLTEVINWSWWLVLLPMYGPLVVFLIIVGTVVAFSGRK